MVQAFENFGRRHKKVQQLYEPTTSPKSPDLEDLHNMGAPKTPGSSSLDRLKVLDNLPDLKSQLQEAKQLCDHRARAEMILKWLMTKLKISDEARQSDSSWNLLASTVRLVPAQRIVVLSNGLLPTLQQTWAAKELSDDTLLSIARLLGILLEIGKGPDGAAIRSMLGVKGDTAATMCGDWYRHLYHNFSKEGKLSMLSRDALLEPALHLWELRKHMEDDDISFNSHCLLPILLLLGRLRSANTTPSVKRKREHDTAVSVSSKSYEHALEALMAKHTVLPARTIFNRKHEQQPRRMQHGDQKMVQPAIKERLSLLKEAIAGNASGDPIADSLWLVLDVAMRSVSTPTPRHRFAERPWIETLFSALGDCVASQSRLEINRVLIELLETVRRNGAGHSALSAQLLTGLVKNNAISAATSDEDIDWQLVAKVVELDSGVLTNITLNEELFAAIGDVKDHQTNALATVWRDGIVVPTMKAYARGRSLASFVDIWYTQLLRPRDTTEPSVWESLDVPFADILEENLLKDQIIALIDRFSLPVSAAVEGQSKLNDEDVASALVANIVLLESLLSGTRSDDLVSSLQAKLDALLHTSIDLANLKGFKSTIATSSHYWRLLTRAFQLWFPFWATKQDGDAEVEREGMTILTSKAFKYALAQCSVPKTETARAARGFVASLCACFHPYGGEQGCASQCEKAMEHIAKSDVGAASVLVRRQALLSILDSDARKELLSSPFLLTPHIKSEEKNTPTAIEGLMASSRGIGKHKANEEAVSAMLEQLSDVRSGAQEQTLISNLANIDVLSIEQAQRVKILDRISQLGGLSSDDGGAALLQARLALLLKLLALPSQNAQLLSEPAKLWELSSLLRPDGSSSQLDSLANVQLLEDIVRCVLKSLLSTQDSQRSQKTIVEISQLIKDGVKLGAKKNKLSSHAGHISFIKIAAKMLEAGAREDVKSSLVHRAPKTAKAYLDTLLAECSSLSAEKGTKLTTTQGRPVISAMQALLEAPESLVEASGLDVADHTKRLYKLARELMSPTRVPDDPILQSRLLAVCFHLICKCAPAKKNPTTVAKDVLEHDLKPRDLVSVLLAYEEAFKNADAEWKLTAIATVTKDEDLQQSSTILLQQAIIRALSKEDAEAIPPAKNIVNRTLEAATSSATPLTVRRTALRSLALIFKDKAFLTTQYTIEQTLSGLQATVSSHSSSDIGELYLIICQVLTTILAQHRSRLQGRFHLVVGLLQQLTSHLFSDGRSEVHQARSLAKLLESFCNPPALRYRKGGKPSELVDEAKKAQAHAGQFAQYLLHFYCSCVLTGSLGEGVREALLPGLWAVIEAMEAYNEEGIKVLSSAVNNSERAVLRSIYEDYKRFGKWEGV